MGGAAQAQLGIPHLWSNVSIAPAPDAAALAEYAETPVSLYTGTADISVPIATVSGRRLGVPVSLAYHGGGIRVDDIASRVGLGWVLNAGGMITRSVQGLPDESGAGFFGAGGPMPVPVTQGDHLVTDSNYTAAEFGQIDLLAKGRLDGAPDAFFINFPGGSGRVYFDGQGVPHLVPYAKLKIEVNWNTHVWIVTDLAGTRYTFGGAMVEQTTMENSCGDGGGLNYVSTWYLTRIEDCYGDVITLDYVDDAFVTIDYTPQSRILHGVTVSGYCGSLPVEVCQQSSSHTQKRISSISGAQGKVSILYDAVARTDVAGSHRVSAIQVLDRSGVVLKTHTLTHGYWSGRLELEQLVEAGPVGSTKPPYVFTYDHSHALPAAGSAAQDFWGYYNGKTNVGLVPYTPVGTCDFEGNADRNPDFNFGKSGLLTKIHYPAGGETSFEYEAHDIPADPNAPLPLLPLTVQADAHCHGNDPQCNGPLSHALDEVSFVLDHDQCVRANVILGNSALPAGECGAYAKLLTASGQQVRLFPCSTQNLSADISLVAGSYKIVAGTDMQGDHATIILHYTSQIPTIGYQKEMGGARIKSITTYDGLDHAQDQVRSFKYRKTSDPLRSSGVAVKLPRFESTFELGVMSPGSSPGSIPGIVEWCTFTTISSSDRFGSASTHGSVIGYSEVQTYFGMNGSNGMSNDAFTSPSDYRDIFSGYVGGPGKSMDHRRGLPTQQTVYSATGKKVAETIHEYSFRPENRVEVLGLAAAYRKTHPVNTGPADNELIFTSYPVISEWLHESKTVSRQYASNGVDFVEKVTTMEYGNADHALPTASRTVDSEGRELIVRSKYPADYPGGGTGSAAIALQQLKAGHRHALVLEQTTSERGGTGPEKVISGTLLQYKEFRPGQVFPEKYLQWESGVPAGNFQPSTISGSFVYDSRYAVREIAEAYDVWGNLLRVRKAGDVPVSFLYGYEGSLPVAQVINGEAAYQDNATGPVVAGSCSYVGFESGQMNAWNPNEDFVQFNVATTVAGAAHSGKYCIQIAAGGAAIGPLRQLRPSDQAGIYLASVWVKAPQGAQAPKLVFQTKQDVDVSGPAYPSTGPSSMVVAAASSNGAWQRVEARLDLGKIRQQSGLGANIPLRIVAFVVNADPTQAVYVDDMRIQPELARMQTATHVQMVGSGSVADANDQLSTYTYDDLQRLQEVRDRDQNILRRIGYSYASQSGAQRNSLTVDDAQVPVTTAAQLAGLAIGARYRSVVFQDGIGRKVQEIGVGASLGNADMVQHLSYDAQGRTAKSWLPFAKSGNNGAFVGNAAAAQSAFYQSGVGVPYSTAPFALSQFESSPLNRAILQGAPGMAWQPGGGHTVETQYVTNNATYPVRQWVISNGNCSSTSLYAAGMLNGAVTDGEDGETIVEFKDKLGRTVCRKVKLLNPAGPPKGGWVISWLETYWVYDDFGNVAFVIPPKASSLMAASGQWNSATLAEDLVFKYVYDGRQRPVEQHVPGKGWDYTIYDDLDRPLLTQDAQLRTGNQWRFAKVDALGRGLMTGLVTDPVHLTRQAMQQYVDQGLAAGTFKNHERRTGVNLAAQHGYTLESFPSPAFVTGAYQPLTVTHYDDYDIDCDGSPDVSPMPDPDGEYPVINYDRLRDQVTGTEVQVMAHDNVTGPMGWKPSYSFYDRYLRLSQSQAASHRGDVELLFQEHDFAGKLLRSKRIHALGTAGAVRVRERYAYDQAGRVSQVWQKNNQDAEVLRTHHVYNALGQLSRRDLHGLAGGGYLQAIDYRYHIRGWLTQINDCAFPAGSIGTNRSYLFQGLSGRLELQTDATGQGRLGLVLDVEGEVKETDAEGHSQLVPMQGELSSILMTQEAVDPEVWKSHAVLAGQDLRVVLPGEGLGAEAALVQAEEAAAMMLEQLVGLGVTDSMALVLAGEATRQVMVSAMRQDAAVGPNTDLFALELKYEQGNTILQGDARFNGDISAMCWRSKTDLVHRGYGYRYDGLHRLHEAHYAAVPNGGTKWTAEVGRYDMPYLSYDPNGNILALRHQGLQQGTTFGQIDDLKYTYSGNRLLSVTDVSAQSGPHDFQDQGASTGLDYGYNANGSLVSDANKGITAITYNHLDLPEKVTLVGGKQIVYLYDAAGTKLAQVLRQPFTADVRTDYVGEFVYQDGVLEFFSQPEGRCVAAGSGFRYEYHYRDHLGNLRLAFSDLDGDGEAEVSEVLQEAAYYPYGMRHEGLAAPAVGVPHRFLFQGKELEGAFGVDWMDFGARRYDAQVGRWWGVDAMAGRRLAVSPYGFVQGNPVGRVDPNGMLDDWYVNRKGVLLGSDGDPKSNQLRLINKSRKEFKTYLDNGPGKYDERVVSLRSQSKIVSVLPQADQTKVANQVYEKTAETGFEAVAPIILDLTKLTLGFGPVTEGHDAYSAQLRFEYHPGDIKTQYVPKTNSTQVIIGSIHGHPPLENLLEGVSVVPSPSGGNDLAMATQMQTAVFAIDGKYIHYVGSGGWIQNKNAKDTEILMKSLEIKYDGSLPGIQDKK